MGNDVIQGVMSCQQQSQNTATLLCLQKGKKIKASKAEVNNPSMMVAGGDNEAFPILG